MPHEPPRSRTGFVTVSEPPDQSGRYVILTPTPPVTVLFIQLRMISLQR